MATRQDHVDGVLAALDTDLTPAYSVDALPEVLPPYYIEVAVSRRVGGVQRHSGERDGRLFRFTARAVARTLANAYRMWDAIDALEEQPLTVAGLLTTPVEFETEDAVIAPDSGWYSGVRSLTYALI